MSKHILVIGGRDSSVVKPAKLGVHVTLFQQQGSITEAQARMADTVVAFDSLEWKGAIEIARDIHRVRPFNAAVSFWEMGLEIASRIGEELGIRCNPVGAVLSSRDKVCMRRLLESDGHKNVRFQECHSMDDVEEFATALGTCGILKPIAGSGSAGVHSFSSPAEARCAWEWAVATAPPPLLAEEFIQGAEISVEGITLGGVHEILSVTMKETTGPPHFIETGHLIPAGLEEYTLEQVKTATLDLLNLIGHQEGPSHTELRLGSDGPVIIETHTRIGGDQIWEMLELVYGRDQIAETCAHLLNVNCPPIEPQASAAGIQFFLPAGKRLKSLSGLEAASQMPGVVRISIPHDVGDLIPELSASKSRLGYILVSGSSVQSVRGTLRDVCDSIVIGWDL